MLNDSRIDYNTNAWNIKSFIKENNFFQSEKFQIQLIDFRLSPISYIILILKKLVFRYTVLWHYKKKKYLEDLCIFHRNISACLEYKMILIEDDFSYQSQ